MLQAVARDGRARVCAWTPGGSSTVTTPALVVPDVPLAPEGGAIRLGTRWPDAPSPVRFIAQGTHFHPLSRPTGQSGAPSGATAFEPLVVPAPLPAPTDAVQVMAIGSEATAWHDAGAWCSNPARAVTALPPARREAGAARLLWAPMLGDPADYALWTYLGVDLFDAAPLLLAAARGVALTVDGPMDAAAMLAVHGPPAGGSAWDARALAAFSVAAAERELALVRHAISTGTLRALVERRAATRPSSVEVLRRFDREHDYLEEAAPTHRTSPLACMTADSLWGPEVERFRRRFRQRARPPAGADVLVLLPCSARKPYKSSKTHRYFQRALDASGVRARCHEVMVTSPLGLVPRELEEAYPAAAYDVPVTGRWMRDEQDLIRGQLEALLAAGAYRHVVAHVPPGTWSILQDLLPGAIVTAGARPSSAEDCIRLTAALRGLPAAPLPNWPSRRHADVASVAAFQFGPDAAAALLEGARTAGRPPYLRVEGPEGQLAATTPERGVLSLTLAGAMRIAPFEGHRVRIGDFWPKGTSTLFSVGVERADAGVRCGDEVVVVRNGQVRAVGVATMAGHEMGVWKRGAAVALRHVARPGEPEGTPATLAAAATRQGTRAQQEVTP